MIVRVLIVTPYGLRASYRRQKGFDFRLDDWRLDQLLTRVPGGYAPNNDNEESARKTCPWDRRQCEIFNHPQKRERCGTPMCGPQ